MTSVAYTRPHLYAKQQSAFFTSKRYSFIEASAQPLDTMIPTPHGWRQFGDLEVGDLVFSHDGIMTPVTAIIPHGRRKVYKLRFTGNAETRACGDHLWLVEQDQGRGSKIVNTDYLADLSESSRHHWIFPVLSRPVEYWDRPVPMDPWLLGVLIGDGSICGNVLSISSADKEIIDRVREKLPCGYHIVQAGEYSFNIKANARGAGYERPTIRFKADGYEVYVAKKYIGRRWTYDEALALHKDAMINEYGEENIPEVNLRQVLRELGLLGLKHNEKFVPEVYIYNNPDVRLQILQGLLDTDGSMVTNTPVIEQTSSRLAANIEDIVKSLGGFAKTTYTPPRKEGWKPSYRTNIRHPDAASLFWLPRKRDKCKGSSFEFNRRLVSIEPDGEEEVQCISVEHPTGLYLTSDFLVTHNTKAGKTVAAIAWIIEQALKGSPGQNFWWVAPISDQARIAFTRIKAGLTAGTFTARETPSLSIALINGTTIWFKSADNPDSLYGEDVYAAVVDEASRCKEESWHALRSTLTATQGPVRVIGNVKGRKNWFYRLARMAQAGARPNMHYEKITVLDAIAAGVIAPDEVEDARATLPEQVFRELYMAEPSDDGGNPFGLTHIEACVRPALSRKAAVAFGIDLAKKQDYLVVLGLDEDGVVCHFSRWQGVPWRESIRRIWDIVGEDAPALVDSTGLGDPVLEELQYGHGNFRGYHFSPSSKQKLMEGLAVSIQSREIGYPDGIIREELDCFEYVMTRTGFSYSAPVGLHDDCVASLALARQQWAEGAPAANLIDYYAQASEASRESLARVPGLLLDTDETPPNTQHSPKESLDNELTELYESTLRRYQPEELKCFRCHESIGGDRVSDGVYVWHRDCIAGGRLAA